MSKKEIQFFILIGVTTLFLSFILLISNNNQSKTLLGFLPFIYGFLYIGIARIHYHYNSPGMFLVNCISALRYLVLPTLIIFDHNYTDSYGSLYLGSRIMLFESIMIGIFLLFLTRKLYKKRNFDINVIVDRNNNNILKIIVIFAIGVVIFNPTALLQYNFFFMSMANITLIKGRTIITGFNSLILDWGKLILPLLISISFIKNKAK